MFFSTLGVLLVGVCRPVLQILTLFHTIKCNSFSDLASRKLCHHYVDYLQTRTATKKVSENLFEFEYSQLSLNGHLYKRDTSVKLTPRVGPCLSLLLLLESL